jgi:8-oxo-dGTP pyrophosphatase MutT (NUDIX family)
MMDYQELRRKVPAAGGVVYRYAASTWQIVLVGSNAGEWRIPKGICESGEALDETAMREVNEETGLTVSMGSLLGQTSWTYEYKVEFLEKETTFYLMSYTGGAFDRRDNEFAQVTLMPIKDALHALQYESERAILRIALAVLKQEIRTKTNGT